jgi:hypothetical protein
LYDALLNLLSGSLSGTPAAGTAKALGRNRTFRAIGRCGGDVTGAGATCSIAFEESSNGTSGWAAIPGVGALTITEQVGGFATTPTVRPSPEIPSQVFPLPSVTFTTTKDFVRAVPTLGGTTPVFPGISVTVEPVDLTVLPSGR